MTNIYFRRLLQLNTSQALTLPRDILIKLNLNKGDYVKLIDNDDGTITITPIKPDTNEVPLDDTNISD